MFENRNKDLRTTLKTKLEMSSSLSQVDNNNNRFSLAETGIGTIPNMKFKNLQTISGYHGDCISVEQHYVYTLLLRSKVFFQCSTVIFHHCKLVNAFTASHTLVFLCINSFVFLALRIRR
jgi:hypothetical protein